MSPGSTLLVLAVGVVIVVGGVLVFRLHAFLALIFAALAVSLLTPAAVVERTLIHEKGAAVASVDPVEGRITLAAGEKYKIALAAPYAVVREGDAATQRDVGALQFASLESADAASQTLVVAAEDRPLLDEVQSGDWIVPAGDRKAAAATSRRNVGAQVAADFGATCAQIAILIAMASIVGKCLLDSGAADRIVRSALAVVGERGAPGAFVGSGFLLGIPVFFDTVFYLMIPLGKALRMRTGRNYLLYVLTIVAGATMAHSLVPPTPGPLFVAEALGVNLGVMIAVGCVIGLVAGLSGYLFAAIVSRRWDVPLREGADVSLEELKSLSERDLSLLPPLSLSLLPILLPVLLIAGSTLLATLIDNGVAAVSPNVAFVSFQESESGAQLLISEQVRGIASGLGDKNIALVLAALVSIFLLVWKMRPTRDKFAGAMQGALASAGTIILITAAGGAFGGALKQTGVAELIGRPESHSQVTYLLLGFFITTAIRTAQGSATVAMITSVGILAPLAASGDLGFHPVYLAMAIGCGSKPIAWMNDSGFWVICKMSGMTETEGLRSVTPMSIIMGLTGLAATLIGATFFPLVTQ
jgi:gluconate:H+ symporter, GntP family